MADDIRTLADIQEEIAPQGRLIGTDEKADLVGHSLLVETFNFWEGTHGPAIHITFVDTETGERLATNFGAPMAKRMAKLEAYLPFSATLMTRETKQGFMYDLE